MYLGNIQNTPSFNQMLNDSQIFQCWVLLLIMLAMQRFCKDCCFIFLHLPRDKLCHTSCLFLHNLAVKELLLSFTHSDTHYPYLRKGTTLAILICVPSLNCKLLFHTSVKIPFRSLAGLLAKCWLRSMDPISPFAPWKDCCMSRSWSWRNQLCVSLLDTPRVPNATHICYWFSSNMLPNFCWEHKQVNTEQRKGSTLLPVISPWSIS